jgi:alkylation response protein AidB-like acyl-CoA dehydrogenase
MPSYKAPLRDYRFCLNEVFDYGGHCALPGFADFSDDVVSQILEEGAKFSEQVLFPLNQSGDDEGCKLENGIVSTPRGFREAYRLYCEGGWPSLTCDPEHGGQGMPHMVNVLFEEMMGSANLSFCLYPGLTRGAYVAISKFGTAEQKALYAPRLASGEWAGSMCLTEAHSGTDLGLLKTTAVAQADGSFSITGTKIFISAGEHDLAPNIIYLVLARLPDAPRGTKGISLFVVPKVLSDVEGRLKDRNTVSCGTIERKMGIHACSTCVMNFDGATGWLVGEPHQGLKAMFSMMNTERIAVGIQGLAIAEASYQNAVTYARERLQGRSPKGPQQPSRPADPIIVHPDVRHMLLTQRALIEGCRALALWAAQALDVSERHPDRMISKQADELVALLTPVVKAFLTDSGSEAANLGVQVFGGHGYIWANGQEQLLRDARITQIYEGTNGVQSLDLLGRKVLQLGLLTSFQEPAASFLSAHEGDERLAEFIMPVSAALDLLDNATRLLRDRAASMPEEASATATDYMELFALTALGYLWARMAMAALPKLDDEFYRAKVATARFYMQRILPRTISLHAMISAGASPVMELDEASF